MQMKQQVAPKRCGHTIGKSVVDRDEAYRRIKVDNARCICDCLLLRFYSMCVDEIDVKQILIDNWWTLD